MDNFRQLMQSKGYNQQTLSAKCGVNQSTVSRWCKGTVEPPDYVVKLMQSAPEAAVPFARSRGKQTLPRYIVKADTLYIRIKRPVTGYQLEPTCGQRFASFYEAVKFETPRYTVHWPNGMVWECGPCIFETAEAAEEWAKANAP